MTRNNREKYIGLNGRHNWDEKSYVEVSYEPLYGNLFQKVVTIHLAFDTIEEHKAAWDKFRQEDIDGRLYADSNFVTQNIAAAFNSCIMPYNRNTEKWLHADVKVSQLGWRLDGWGRMRRK